MSDSNAFGFSQFVPGFDFLKQLSQTPTVAPQAQHWIAPTLDPEEIEKRIQELKTVMFWLEQNSKAVAASVQALEVQLMTLKTLKGMNLSMAELAKSMEIKPSMFTPSKPETPTPEASSPFSWTPKADSGASAPREPAPSPSSNWPFTPDKPASEQSTAPPDPEPTPPNDKAQVPPTSGAAPDPMLWWAQLSQQFQTIASKTLTDIQNAQKAQADLAAKTAPAQEKTSAPSSKASKATPATSPSAAKVQRSAKPAAAHVPKVAKANKVKKTKKAPVKTPAPKRAASPSTQSRAAEKTPSKVSNKASNTTSSKAPPPTKSAASNKSQPKPRVNPSAFKGLDTLF